MRARHRITRPIRRGAETELLEAVLLGEGGFERRVAIERLLPELAGDPAAVKRFQDEARVMSRLHHANIVSVIDFGSTDGAPSRVLEHVDGFDLTELASRAVSTGAGVEAAAVLFICAEVARALDYAHRKGNISHGKLSGESILVSHAGDVKLAGFGAGAFEPRADLSAMERMVAEIFPKMAGDFPKSCTTAAELASRCSTAMFARGGADGREVLAAWLARLDITATEEERKASVTDPAPGSSTADPFIGTIVGEHEVLELLGKGGFARVYRARQVVIGAEVALKVLNVAPGEERLAKRFRREIDVLGKLDHPNVVKVIDAGQTENGLAWFTMENLRGETLRKAAKQPFSEARAANIAKQIASALGAAHARGFVHRDLAAGNVMLVRDEHGRERVKVLDFGIARLLFPEGTTRLTSPESTLGTPRFMAPEQIANPDRAGPPADLYSLGALMVLMLTAAPPFVGSAREVMEKHLREPPPDLSAFGGLGALATALLAKDPEQRPASAEAVIAAIEALGIEELEEAVASLGEAMPTEIARAGAPETEIVRSADIVRSDSVTAARVPVRVEVRNGARWSRSVAIAAIVIAAAAVTGVFVRARSTNEEPVRIPAVAKEPKVVAQPRPERVEEPPPPPVRAREEQRERAPVRPPEPASKPPREPDPSERLRSALVERGWTISDAGEVPAFAEWSRAADPRDRDTALTHVVEQLSALGIEELTTRRLDRVLRLLENAAKNGAIDSATLSGFDARYLALRAALGRQPVSTVALSASKLELEIKAALR